MRAYRVPKSEVEPLAEAAWWDVDELGLYVQVPFCKARCRYCEYCVVDSSAHNAEDVYFDALLRELELYCERLDTTRKTLSGFDIGGGTPSFVKPEHIRRVVEATRESFCFKPGMVISIETMPVIADREPEKMRAYKAMGIDRISMGVQTTHLKLARSLNREFDGLTMLESAVRNIRDAGFDRFNIDLMLGFPNQTAEGWGDTVRQTIALGPEYITLYKMRYKGTRMQDQAALVTREKVNALETVARDLLLAAGWKRTNLMGDGTPWLDNHGDRWLSLSICDRLFGWRQGEVLFQLVDYKLTSNGFELSFLDGMCLSVSRPHFVSTVSGSLIVRRCERVRFSWYGYGRPRTPENLHEIVYEQETTRGDVSRRVRSRMKSTCERLTGVREMVRLAPY